MLCNVDIEHQQHILKCKVLLKEFKSEHVTAEEIEYEDIFSEKIQKQKAVTRLFKDLFKCRNNLIEKKTAKWPPSNTGVMLEMSDLLLSCIVN